MTNDDNQAGRSPGQNSRGNEENADFAGSVNSLVEGKADADTIIEAPYPEASEIDEIDRSMIIASDARSAAGWALRFIVIVIASVILLRLLSYVWVGILPIILAILVSTILWPPTRFMRKKGLPAALASLLSILLFFVIIIGVFAMMAPVVSTQGRQIVDQAIEGINQIITWFEASSFAEDFNFSEIDFDALLNDALAFLQDQSSNIASGVFTGVSAATSIVITLFVMLVITFFMLKDGDRFLPLIRRYTGESAGWHLSEVLTRSWNTLSGFIRTQALVSFIDAFFIGIGLWILGVPLAFVLAVITFFAGFIPIVGAFTAGALAVVIALVTNGFTTALLALALIILVQQLEGNILQPVLQSKAMNLHAAVVLLSVTVGSTLFGIIGAFLAVPVAATVAVWIRYHSEMVALRAGEITVDDVEIATAQGQTMSSREAFSAVRDHLGKLTKIRNRSGATAASKSDDKEVAEQVVEKSSD